MGMPENRIARGELYFVHLDPAFGREIGGYKPRPIVVVSIDGIRQNTRVVSVVPGTSKASIRPNVVKIDPDSSNRLQEPTFFQCQQVRSIDQGRMSSPAIGRLTQADLRRIEDGLRYALGLLKT
jgi:mRNA-degrading endonuclease toxin of MazEF toxin-antitoxin module